MSEHTKEPWIFTEDEFFGLGVHTENYKKRIAQVSQSSMGISEEHRANGKRIVICVNALAGIEDPEAFVKAAKEFREMFVVNPDSSNDKHMRKRLKAFDAAVTDFRRSRP